MKFTRPLQGQVFDITAHVSLEGIAGHDVATVQLIVDDQFELPSATIIPPDENGVVHWALSRRFTGIGLRKITAFGLDAAGNKIAGETASVEIKIDATHLGNYHPPVASLGRLGEIATVLESAVRLSRSFAGGKVLFRLPDGQLYIDSDLDLDTDGSQFSEGHDHQTGTSLRDVHGHALDADAIPFFVLPGGGFAASEHIKLGDIAAVIFGDKIEFAIYGDNGPSTKIGEGSIALHRSLGFERIRPNGTVRDVAIGQDVLTIVFPGSGRNPALPLAEIRSKGADLFRQLGGHLDE